ncbi:RluA family pseudouridine synthase [Bacillaceae bacterium S4-13-56]
MQWVILKEQEGMLVREYLLEVQHLSRSLLTAIKKNGDILVNGKHVTVRYALSYGDQIEIFFPPETHGKALQPEFDPIQIIFEDQDVLVIWKEPGIPTIPSREHPTGTLAHFVLGYYKTHEIPYTFHVVTRLDKDTSGLVLIAKHRYSHGRLSELHQKGEVKRRYQAIVEGFVEQDVGTIDEPISRHPESIIQRMVSPDGQRATTHYKVIKRGEMEGDKMSLLEIELETGRTHQIRVHFSFIGHPLLGDDLYGGRGNWIQRQALHCYSLRFTHPFTGETKKFHIPLQEDMEQIGERL